MNTVVPSFFYCFSVSNYSFVRLFVSSFICLFVFHSFVHLFILTALVLLAM